jgi:hypothetical protein
MEKGVLYAELKTRNGWQETFVTVVHGDEYDNSNGHFKKRSKGLFGKSLGGLF